jgi:hypothetical protein
MHKQSSGKCPRFADRGETQSKYAIPARRNPTSSGSLRRAQQPIHSVSALALTDAKKPNRARFIGQLAKSFNEDLTRTDKPMN